MEIKIKQQSQESQKSTELPFMKTLEYCKNMTVFLFFAFLHAKLLHESVFSLLRVFIWLATTTNKGNDYYIPTRYLGIR